MEEQHYLVIKHIVIHNTRGMPARQDCPLIRIKKKGFRKQTRFLYGILVRLFKALFSAHKTGRTVRPCETEKLISFVVSRLCSILLYATNKVEFIVVAGAISVVMTSQECCGKHKKKQNL